MIYSVHFYYSKLNSRKQPNKFEGIVFAKDQERVKELIEDMIKNYPIKLQEPLSIVGGVREKSLQEIYDERPELIGISPEQGYIYNEFPQKISIKRYVG
ncbi:MAG: hypothetical protein Q8920_04260 [Bacillota bacterium]|nr:hypothetical protein [Bacillota bacterium]